MRIVVTGCRGSGSPGSGLPQARGAVPAGDTPMVWAVRHDWSDGCHTFARPAADYDAAVDQLEKAHAYWLCGPWRPALSLVQINDFDFRRHGRFRGPCRSADCPGGPQGVAQPAGGAR